MGVRSSHTLQHFGLALLLTSSPSLADDLFVKPTGSGTACTQSSPCSLAAALATMVNGDTICLAAGTYTGSGSEVVLLDESVSLLGGWNGAPSGAIVRDPIAYESILDGQNARRVVKVVRDNVAVDGLTITHGNASGSGAECSLVAESACGGGVAVLNSASVTISNNLITANVADSAPAPAWRDAHGGGIVGYNTISLQIVGNTIVANIASTVSAGQGGGVSLNGCAGARIAGNRVVDNVASTSGVVGWGGGISLYSLWSGGAIIEGNVFAGNRAGMNFDASHGNAFFTWYARDITFRGNWVASDNGGSAVYLGFFAGRFEGNNVRAGADQRTVWLVNGQDNGVTAANNILAAGGGTLRVVDIEGYSEQPITAILAHNTVVGNGGCAGIHAGDYGIATLDNNIIANHAVGIETAGTGIANADHTLFWNNLADGIRGSNPIDGDPMFVNAPAGDFHLQEASAAIGAGADAGVATDIDGEPRPGLGGADVGADELAPPRFDFGTPASPVGAGYVQVNAGTTFLPERGFGWTYGTIGARDRAVGDDLRRDFCFTHTGTFAVTIPNGRYRVTLTMGDATTGHGQMAIHLEGQKVATVSTAGNEFKTLTLETAVTDGQLTLWLNDEGGSDPNVVINALVIERVPRVRVDLGTAASPLAAGYSRGTHASAYSPAVGFGWRGGILQSRDRGTADALRRDFVFTPRGLLSLFLPNGVYDLTLTLGDAAGAHAQMGVSAQGATPDAVTTAKNQFVTRRYRTAVADNRLDVLLDDLAGPDPNVVLNAVEVAAPPPAFFDFGTPASPVGGGYQQVTHTTTYTAQRGYGWLSGIIGSRDRGAGSVLTRDLNFTPDGTFVVDVPAGRYEVRVTLGDATVAHDRMALYLEGNLIDVVTGSAGTFITKTSVVNVVDGQLTLQLDDQGGADPNAVINVLEIRQRRARRLTKGQGSGLPSSRGSACGVVSDGLAERGSRDAARTTSPTGSETSPGSTAPMRRRAPGPVRPGCAAATGQNAVMRPRVSRSPSWSRSWVISASRRRLRAMR